MAKISVPRYRLQRNLARNTYDLFDYAEGCDQEAGTEIRAVAYLQDWEAQVILDDLWQSGMRPSQGVASAGALDEAHEHIATLRRMVKWVNP